MQHPFNALILVISGGLDGNAAATSVAVEEVFSSSLSAHSAVITVELGFVDVVVKEAALFAVVLSELCFAVDALIGDLEKLGK